MFRRSCPDLRANPRGRAPSTRRRDLMDDYENIRALVDLTRLAFQAEHGELVANYDPPLAITAGTRCGHLLGLEPSLTAESTIGNLPKEHPSNSSYAVVPLGPVDADLGSSVPGLTGWLAIARSRTKPFNAETVETLEAAARCIAITLERAGAPTTIRRMQDELDRLRTQNDHLRRECASARQAIGHVSYHAAKDLVEPLSGAE